MCTIIPPIVAKRIEENSEGVKKMRAKRALKLIKEIEAKRDNPKAVEPGLGEDRQIKDAEDQETTGGPVIREEDSPDLPHDPAANAVYDSAGWSYAFYRTILNRNGPDGQGSKMKFNIRYGDHWDNQAFDGSEMLVGEGDVFPPLWKDWWITAHELGHWDTQTRNRLGYSKWDGHLNEGGSDLKTFMTEQWFLNVPPADYHWLIGRVLFQEDLKPYGRALRDGRRKRNGKAFEGSPIIGDDPQFVDMDDFVERSDPHLGSSIINGAFAEACVQHGGFAWLEMGQIHEDVWGRLTPGTSGPIYAQMILDLATERHGVNSKEREAWAFGFDWEKLKPATGPAPDPVPDSPCALSESELFSFVALLRRPEAIALARAVQAHPVGKRLWAVARTLNKETSV